MKTAIELDDIKTDIEVPVMEIDINTPSLEMETSTFLVTGENIDDYEELKNIPSINNVELKGNLTSKDLKVQDSMDALTNIEIQKIWKEGRL